MPSLDYFSIKGFRSIDSLERLALHKINIIIGPNGSGKSNFIGAFDFLRMIRDGRLQEATREAGGADRIAHFGSQKTRDLYFEVGLQNSFSYRLSLSTSQTDLFVPNEEHVSVTNEGYANFQPLGPSSSLGEALLSSETANPVLKRFQDELKSWRVYHFRETGRNSPIKKTGDVGDNRFLRSDGSNLAAFLYRLQAKHEASYNAITNTVRLIAPFFDRFDLQPDRINESKILLEWRQKGSDRYFDATALSDGTLSFIALATLLLQPCELRPSVIIIDEPELGLHPAAITVLAGLIKGASTEVQVIVSTQSAWLLDHFEPQDVLVAERESGATRLRRLDSNTPPRMAKRLQSWRTLGKK